MLLIVFPGLNNYLNACSIQFGSLQTTLLAIGLSVSVVVSHLYVQIVSIVVSVHVCPLYIKMQVWTPHENTSL